MNDDDDERGRIDSAERLRGRPPATGNANNARRLSSIRPLLVTPLPPRRREKDEVIHSEKQHVLLMLGPTAPPVAVHNHVADTSRS